MLPEFFALLLLALAQEFQTFSDRAHLQREFRRGELCLRRQGRFLLELCQFCFRLDLTRSMHHAIDAMEKSNERDSKLSDARMKLRVTQVFQFL